MTTTERQLVTGGNPQEAYPVPTDSEFKDEPGVEQDFRRDLQLVRIAAGLIEQSGATLEHLSIEEIAVLWKRKGGEAGGKPIFGQCKKASGALKFLSGKDWVIWLAADHCCVHGFTRWQIEALVFHELLHAGCDPESLKPIVVGHDFEGFLLELKRYGAWRSDLRLAAKTFGQLRLFDPDTGEIFNSVLAEGSGIEAVTISNGERTVTLDREAAARIDRNISSILGHS